MRKVSPHFGGQVFDTISQHLLWNAAKIVSYFVHHHDHPPVVTPHLTFTLFIHLSSLEQYLINQNTRSRTQAHLLLHTPIRSSHMCSISLDLIAVFGAVFRQTESTRFINHVDKISLPRLHYMSLYLSKHAVVMFDNFFAFLFTFINHMLPLTSQI